MNLLKLILFSLLLLIKVGAHAQVKLCSWNIQNFGKSKSDSEIIYISKTIRDFDLVAIVEVVAGNGGAQAVARLADELNRSGTKWDYCISDPTFGSPNKSERYAFLWKTSKLKRKGQAWLDKNYQNEIEREPYFATFIFEEKEFTVATFHAIPKDKQPETEIKFLKFLPDLYPDKNILFCGDFNCPESHSVFGPLKSMNYQASLTKQKTTLKNQCINSECLASEFDNILYDLTKINFIKAGVLHFYKDFKTLQEARTISDHLPVFLEFNLN